MWTNGHYTARSLQGMQWLLTKAFHCGLKVPGVNSTCCFTELSTGVHDCGSLVWMMLWCALTFSAPSPLASTRHVCFIYCFTWLFQHIYHAHNTRTHTRTHTHTHTHTQLSPLLDATPLLSPLHSLTSHPSLGADVREECRTVADAITGEVAMATNKRRKRSKHRRKRTNSNQ